MKNATPLRPRDPPVADAPAGRAAARRNGLAGSANVVLGSGHPPPGGQRPGAVRVHPLAAVRPMAEQFLLRTRPRSGPADRPLWLRLFPRRRRQRRRLPGPLRLRPGLDPPVRPACGPLVARTAAEIPRPGQPGRAATAWAVYSPARWSGSPATSNGRWKRWVWSIAGAARRGGTRKSSRRQRFPPSGGAWPSSAARSTRGSLTERQF